MTEIDKILKKIDHIWNLPHRTEDELELLECLVNFIDSLDDTDYKALYEEKCKELKEEKKVSERRKNNE